METNTDKRRCGWFRAALALLVAAMLFSGCGSDSRDAAESEPVDCEALLLDLMEADTTLPEMTVVTDGDEKGELNFSAFSDFDYERVAGYAYAYAKDGGVCELALIQLKDSSDAAALMSTLKNHLEFRRGTLSEYAPDQLTLIEHAVIKQKDSLVIMIISEKSGLVQQAFEAAR
jgi:hypothetical protein